MNIMPEYANIEKDGQIVQVEPETVAIGDIIIVQPGEKVPLDGTVIEGETFVDTAALTGESVPRKLSVGDEVLSGVINQNGVIRVKVSKEFDDSTVSKILERWKMQVREKHSTSSSLPDLQNTIHRSCVSLHLQ